MRFLLDTNAVIGILKGNRKLALRLRQYLSTDFGIPAVVAHEMFYGAYRSQQSHRNLARVEALRLEILAFDKEDAREAGSIRAALAKLGTPIGSYDVLIAGQAKSRDLTLITHNIREFSRVDGLQIEDWE